MCIESCNNVRSRKARIVTSLPLGQGWEAVTELESCAGVKSESWECLKENEELFKNTL